MSPAPHDRLPKYRPEIDGLRALAVVPVILFHAGFQPFGGGYVGVDVFFVISGYLITTIIVAELGAGKFSLVRFYERRARRILPALYLVMAACIPFSWLWLLPGDLEDFSKSLAAVSLFASNLLFARESGYFAQAAELKPLLHTWSLAVEEQFYVVFPLFLIIAWRFGRKWVVAVLVLASVACLAFAHRGSLAQSTTTFFLLPARGWELALGGLAALYRAEPRTALPPAVSNFLAALGLILILCSIAAFREDTPFPSLYTLLPTVGTALIILFAMPHTAAGKLLGSRLLVGVGLLSYSAYLWHQPLFAFARHQSLDEPGVGLLVALCVVTFFLAYFSWRFVEQPFRDKRRPVLGKPATIFLASGACGLAFVVYGVAVSSRGSALMGYSDPETSPDRRLRPNAGLAVTCTRFDGLEIKCLKKSREVMIVYGDSYAMHLATLIEELRPDATLFQLTQPACSPLAGLAQIRGTYDKNWAARCIGFNEAVLRYLRTVPPATVVIGSAFANTVSGKLLTADGSVVEDQQLALTIAALRKTIARILETGHNVVVFFPPHNSGVNIGQCLAKTAHRKLDPAVCDFEVSRLSTRSRSAMAVMKGIERDYKVVRISDAHCDNRTCRASIDGKWIFRDGGHLSVEGSRLIARLIGWSHVERQTNRPQPHG